jgi:hypothetical protein
MSAEACQDCKDLWREHGIKRPNAAFAWTQRLRRAEFWQDHDLARILAAKLAYLARETTRTRQALEDHQAEAHLHTSAAGGSEIGC